MFRASLKKFRQDMIRIHHYQHSLNNSSSITSRSDTLSVDSRNSWSLLLVSPCLEALSICTTATDGRTLMVASQRYTIRDTPAEDIIVRATATHTTTILAAEIEVLRDFAAAYTRGEHVSCQMTVKLPLAKLFLLTIVM